MDHASGSDHHTVSVHEVVVCSTEMDVMVAPVSLDNTVSGSSKCSHVYDSRALCDHLAASHDNLVVDASPELVSILTE